MPPKRAGKPLSCKIAAKIPKSEEATNANNGIKKVSASQIQELELALDQGDTSRVLLLGREIAKTPDLPANVAMRLLKYCVGASSEVVARQLLTHQKIDLKTPEGGKLLWRAMYLDNEGEITALLIRSGADLSFRQSDYEDNEITLLHKILMGHWIDDKREKLFRLMLDFGADVNAHDSLGHSLLHYAIKNFDNCSYQLARELLKHGAEITISKDDDRMDDLCLACKHKLQLLPDLIQQRVPDEETRNSRGAIAIEFIISESYNIGGAKQAAMMQMIKKILDLGVPVNYTNTYREEKRISFLNKALYYKNKPAVKLLLECGAEPHQINIFGQTTLYQATAFKGFTHVCRWLIARGVSIHFRNYNGAHPIHGACENDSIRNLHLLLNLGADLNATDKYGQTPFQGMKMKETTKCRETHHLVIKHFALTIAKGGKISKEDLIKTHQCAWSKNHFENCTEQLGRMKLEKVYGDISYFSLLSKNIYGMVLLMKNKTFIDSFKKDQKKQATLFPEFLHMLWQSLEIAEDRLEVLLVEKEKLHEVFLNAMPDHIIERIAYYLHFEKLERCRHDYYMSFHETLKFTQPDKAKIL